MYFQQLDTTQPKTKFQTEKEVRLNILAYTKTYIRQDFGCKKSAGKKLNQV